MPNINEILLKLECLQYVLLLDLNMGYYHILLSKNSSNLCMLILPRVKYSYKCLPMGIAHSLEIFQHTMNDLFFIGFEFIRGYIDELFDINKKKGNIMYRNWKYL